MINRVLIRLKVVQIVYAYYKNSGKSMKAAEDEMFFSLSKAYDLYQHLLLLMPAVVQYAYDRMEFNKTKLRPTESDLNPNRKFVDNLFIAQLRSNQQLVKFAEKNKFNWVDYSDFVRRLLDTIEASDIYKEYMATESSSYEQDREVWRKLYKAFIFDNQELDTILEDISLYWNDDKPIVDTFVLKTIKRFEQSEGSEQAILPEYKDLDDMDYARRLLRATIANAEEYKALMSTCTKNWEVSRFAFMDVIVMQTAIAELFTFGDIPASVTLNEYVEIAKYYSTPKSCSFVNGVLDNIVKKLRNDGRIE